MRTMFWQSQRCECCYFGPQSGRPAMAIPIPSRFGFLSFFFLLIVSSNGTESSTNKPMERFHLLMGRGLWAIPQVIPVSFADLDLH